MSIKSQDQLIKLQHSLVRSQKQLEILLQKLQGFIYPKVKLEQYQTPANIAAAWIWSMHLNNEIKDKTFADLACGPGILGLGLLVMGAKQIHFVDIDKTILQTAKQNYKDIQELAKQTNSKLGQAQFHNIDVQFLISDNFISSVNCVIQNPPFGTKQKHIDKLFLETAFKLAKTTYTMHKITTEPFIIAITKDYGFQIINKTPYKFPLKNTMKHHKKKLKHTEVAVWKLQKIEKTSYVHPKQENT